MTRSFLDGEMERIMMQFSWKSLNLSFLLHYSNRNTLTNPPWIQITFFFESIRDCAFSVRPETHIMKQNSWDTTIAKRVLSVDEILHPVSLPGILKALRNPAARKHDSCCSVKLYCDRHYCSHLYSALCSYNPDLFRAATCPVKGPHSPAFLTARHGRVT